MIVMIVHVVALRPGRNGVHCCEHSYYLCWNNLRINSDRDFEKARTLAGQCADIEVKGHIILFVKCA